MRVFYLTLIFLFSPAIRAQVVFCPPGTSWNACYNEDMRKPNSNINVSIKYTGDTTIALNTFKILKHSKFFRQCNYIDYTTLIKQSGDTIFFRNIFTKNKWQILFNYASTVGAGWTTSYYLEDSTICNYSFTVDTVKYVLENSFNLKQLICKVSIDNLGFVASYEVSITERYGWGFLFFYYNSNDGCEENGFCGTLCYKDNAFGTKLFSALSCDYQNPVGIIRYEDVDRVSNIFPNPANDKTNLQISSCDEKNFSVQIIDLRGRALDLIQVKADSDNELNTSKYEAGIYFVNILYEGKRVETRKLVIVK